MEHSMERSDVYRILFNLRNGCTKQEKRELYPYIVDNFSTFSENHKLMAAAALASAEEVPTELASLIAGQEYHISRHFLTNRKNINLDTIMAAINTNFSQKKIAYLLKRKDLSQEAIDLLLPHIGKYRDLITLITHNCDNFSTQNIANTIALYDKYHIYLHLFSKHRSFNHKGFEGIIAKLPEDIRESLLNFIEKYSFFKYIAQVAEQEKLKKENYRQIDELFANNEFNQEMLVSFIEKRDIDSLIHCLANIFDLPDSSFRQLLTESNFDLFTSLLRYGVSNVVARSICHALL
jgi:uncharacterized protein YqiB (DUF1249 family)